MEREKKGDLVGWKKSNRILLSFSTPKTPTQVQKELGVNRFNLSSFLKKRLLRCLNPEMCKGRLYVLTNKGRKMFCISNYKSYEKQNWDLIGWVMAASPRQRYVVLKTMFTYSREHTSEEIRRRSSKLNPCLSRISTKTILKELGKKGLIETEMRKDRRRYYWISTDGKSIMDEIMELNK